MRAPQNWHQKAIKAAYSSGDKEWMLTAVFLETADPEIHCEAVNAAGNWELDAAGLTSSH